MLNSAEHEKCFNYLYFYFYDQVKFHAQLSWAWKKFYNLGPEEDFMRGIFNDAYVIFFLINL